ncbi:ABC transporter substrate-binding protein [Thiomicrorhabdus sp.]|uniref:ABC transporter substrate-binding protein n=1 Tax=Thiomicrorhabdus sp. TaxID=2039724 RepID=UPI0029C8059F|nr:ABC transporter substrate-binding protein [Thiomicrorhabdus sp.]
MFSSSIRHIAPKSLYAASILILAMISNAAADDACHLKHEPQRVYSANPVVTYLMMAMAPEKLVGWNFPPPPQARGIFPDNSFDKPVIGGWFGQGRTPNMEELIRSKPDLMLLSGATVNTDQQRVVEKLGVPVCYLKLDRLTDYPQDLRNLGHWLGKAQRGEKLAQEVEHILNRLAEHKRMLQAQGALKTVYYAESTSGLATECRGSIHSEAIPLAGGINPHICPNDHAKQSRFGRVDINFEQLLRYNPDAIVTQEIGFYERVYQDAKWRSLKAVQNRQVFFMPQVPFCWMDRPPSFMRLLAAEWLMAQLYPQSLNTDLLKVSGDFIETFFQVRPDDVQLQRILNGEIVDERR